MLGIAKAAAIFILVVLVAALVAALSIEWPERVYSHIPGPPYKSDAALEEYTAPDLPELMKPIEISKVFGYTPAIVRPVTPEPEPAPEPEPVPAPTPEAVPVPPVATWILPVGFVTSGDGERRYVLKVTKPRESIISLGIGESDEGILLVAVEDNSLVIEREEERYLVPLPRR